MFRLNRDKIWHYNVLLSSIFFTLTTEASMSLEYWLILFNLAYLLVSIIFGVVGMAPFAKITDSPFIIYLITYSNLTSGIIGMLSSISFYFGIEKMYFLILANVSAIFGLILHKIAVKRCEPPLIISKTGKKNLSVTNNGKRMDGRRFSVLFKCVFPIFARIVTFMLLAAALVIILIIFSKNGAKYGMTESRLVRDNISRYYIIITNLLIMCFATVAVSVEFVNFFLNLSIFEGKFVNRYRLVGIVINSSYRLVLEQSVSTKKYNETIDDWNDGYRFVKVISERRLKCQNLYMEDCNEQNQYYNLAFWGHVFDKWANELDLKVPNQSRHIENIKKLIADELVQLEKLKIVHEIPTATRIFPPYRSKSLRQDITKVQEISRFHSIPYPLQLPLLECIIPKLDKYAHKGIIERSREEWEKERDNGDELCSFNFKCTPYTPSSNICSTDGVTPIIYDASSNDNMEDIASHLIESESEVSISASQAWDSFINKLTDNNPKDEPQNSGTEQTALIANEVGKISLPEPYLNLDQYQCDGEMIFNDMSNRLAQLNADYETPSLHVNYGPFNVVKGEPMNLSRGEYLEIDMPAKIHLISLVISTSIAQSSLQTPQSSLVYNIPILQHDDHTGSLYDPPPIAPKKNAGSTNCVENKSYPRTISSIVAYGGDAGGTGELGISGESGAVPEGHEFEPVDTNSQDTSGDANTDLIGSYIPNSLSFNSSKLSKLSCNADFSDLDETPTDEVSQSSYTSQSDYSNSYVSGNPVLRTARFGKDSDSTSHTNSVEQVFL